MKVNKSWVSRFHARAHSRLSRQLSGVARRPRAGLRAPSLARSLRLLARAKLRELDASDVGAESCEQLNASERNRAAPFFVQLDGATADLSGHAVLQPDDHHRMVIDGGIVDEGRVAAADGRWLHGADEGAGPAAQAPCFHSLRIGGERRGVDAARPLLRVERGLRRNHPGWRPRSAHARGWRSDRAPARYCLGGGTLVGTEAGTMLTRGDSSVVARKR